MRGKRNHLIQCYRGIICLLVVITHVAPEKNWFYALFWGITGSSMELFMLISGYFMYSSSEEKQLPRLKARISSSFILAVESILFYYVIKFIIMVPTGNWADYYERYLQPKMLFRLIFPNTVAVCGALWYLLALCYSTILLYFLVKHKLEKKFLVLTPVLLLASTFFSGEFDSIIHITLSDGSLSDYQRIFLTNAAPFMLFGFLIHKYEDVILERFRKYINWFVPIAYLLVLVEDQIVGYIGITILSPLVSLSLFLFALVHPELGEGSFLEKVGNENSLHVYVVHWVFAIPAFHFFQEHSYHWLLTYAASFGVWFICIAVSKVYIEGKSFVMKRIPVGKAG